MKTEISALKEDVNTLTTDLTELKEKMDTLINQFNKSATFSNEQQNDSNVVKAFPLYRRHSF
ncbi:GPO family capsid scaffolding protein [Candidatus Arsenophonus triatominarum]|uniref:GPO family capsid scaffolding protein n=1 Tax=Candidatus Arsenophonus triatominarum TaxID=57911 RepID=UPI001396CAAE|nr:GPO family capsid scaffolding protein [Candidatus Arsenophonus triatominarum]